MYTHAYKDTLAPKNIYVLVTCSIHIPGKHTHTHTHTHTLIATQLITMYSETHDRKYKHRTKTLACTHLIHMCHQTHTHTHIQVGMHAHAHTPSYMTA